MVEGGPRTFEELQGRLLEMGPDRDPAVLAYGVRMRPPPVQTPPAGTWGIGGSPRFALSEPWLGVPPRFVPEYDNLVRSHADRRRVIADEGRKKVFLSAARVRATFLIEGFVAGVWRIEKTRKSGILIVEPFAPLASRDLGALAEWGGRLLRFATDGTPEPEVRSEEPG